MNIPVIYFTGNGHNYFIKRGIGHGNIQGDYFWRVQVDSGNNAPPIQVTIQSKKMNPNAYNDFHKLGEHQEILADIIKIDRRGGLYSNISHA